MRWGFRSVTVLQFCSDWFIVNISFAPFRPVSAGQLTHSLLSSRVWVLGHKISPVFLGWILTSVLIQALHAVKLKPLFCHTSFQSTIYHLSVWHIKIPTKSTIQHQHQAFFTLIWNRFHFLSYLVIESSNWIAFWAMLRNQSTRLCRFQSASNQCIGFNLNKMAFN